MLQRRTNESNRNTDNRQQWFEMRFMKLICIIDVPDNISTGKIGVQQLMLLLMAAQGKLYEQLLKEVRFHLCYSIFLKRTSFKRTS